MISRGPDGASSVSVPCFSPVSITRSPAKTFFIASGGAAVQPALNTDLFGLAHAGVNYGLIALGMSAGSLLSYAGSQLLDLPARHMLAVASAVAGGICFLFVKPVATVEKQQGNG